MRGLTVSTDGLSATGECPRTAETRQEHESTTTTLAVVARLAAVVLLERASFVSERGGDTDGRRRTDGYSEDRDQRRTAARGTKSARVRVRRWEVMCGTSQQADNQE